MALLNAIKLSVDRNKRHMHKQVVLALNKIIGTLKNTAHPSSSQTSSPQSINGEGKFS